MQRRRKPLSLLVLSILSFGVLGYLILNFPPGFNFSVINFNLSILIFSFLLLFIFLYSLFGFVLNNKRRGLLIGLFVVIYFLLRLNNLTHPFFLILLLILLVMLELLFAKRK
jgi:hypothetical protein